MVFCARTPSKGVRLRAGLPSSAWAHRCQFSSPPTSWSHDPCNLYDHGRARAHSHYLVLRNISCRLIRLCTVLWPVWPPRTKKCNEGMDYTASIVCDANRPTNSQTGSWMDLEICITSKHTNPNRLTGRPAQPPTAKSTCLKEEMGEWEREGQRQRKMGAGCPLILCVSLPLSLPPVLAPVPEGGRQTHKE
jgi:hypothetical protein